MEIIRRFRAWALVIIVSKYKHAYDFLMSNNVKTNRKLNDNK